MSVGSATKGMSPQLAVTAGSTDVVTQDLTLGRLTGMTFPARLELPRHEHPQATIAVVLRGGFAGTYEGTERDCAPMTIVVEPAGSHHANRFGGMPTTVLSLSLGPMVSPALDGVASTQRFGQDPYAAGFARQAYAELRRPDALTPLAVEALGLELVCRLGRTQPDDGVPAWLRVARDLVDERFTESLRLADVAAAVGVDPHRLARAFRRAYRAPLATYVRHLRVKAAADRLLLDDEASIAAIAVEVGFADQSHLTRLFARVMGTTPARYRAARRRRHT